MGHAHADIALTYAFPARAGSGVGALGRSALDAPPEVVQAADGRHILQLWTQRAGVERAQKVRCKHKHAVEGLSHSVC